MARTAPILVAAAAAAALVVAFLWNKEPKPAPLPQQPQPAPKATAPGPAPAAGPVARELPPIDPKADRTGWLAYPDGSSYPPLNGVKTAPKLTWHKQVPFTRVVRIERDGSGRDWYVHENGARSTTYLDARGQVMSDIELPMPTQPLIDESANGK